ncbi:MAG: hypothetical protein A2170_11765 [Deltaproteobacteria bacterium RBG_13_53_10]|nr:MAG: hypothetical protein A2170_11765 [Deltaproteobacteria bacterium RBG_13_53_10]
MEEFLPEMIMKDVFKKSRPLLIALLSFWFVIFPAYLYFSFLDQSDLAAPYPCFKSSDQEDSTSGSKKKEKSLESTFFIKHTYLDHLSLVQVSHPSFQRPRLNSTWLTLRLRC